MANVVGELVWKMTGDDSQLKNKTKESEKRAKSLGKAFKAAGNIIKASFAVAAVAGIAKFSKALVDAASDASEAQNAVNVTFKESSDIIQEFAQTSATAVGLSSTKFKELSTVIGSQLKQSGKPLQDVANDTINLTERAADLASVYNVEVKEATNALGAALRGESEPARRFGVLISDAAVQAEALASGLVSSKSEITDQIKVQARLNLIFKQSADVQGDFKNTSDGLANSQRILRERLADISAQIGVVLLPAAEKLVGFLNDSLTVVIDSVNKKTSTLSRSLAILGGLFRVVSQIVVTGLKGWVILFSGVKDAVAETAGAIVKLLKGDIGGAISSVIEGQKELAGIYIDSGKAIIDAGKGIVDIYNDVSEAIKGAAEEQEKLVKGGGGDGAGGGGVKEGLEVNKALWADYLGFVGDGLSAIGNLQSAISNRRLDEFDVETERERERLQSTITDEEQLSDELKKLDEERAKQRAELEYKGALAGWRIQVATAGANAAQAVISTLAGQPGGAISKTTAAAIIGGISAIQVAAVAASRPVKPAGLATGGIVMPTAGGVPTVQAENGASELSLNGGPEGEALLNEFASKVATAGGGAMAKINIIMDNIVTKSGIFDLSKNREITFSAGAII
jgi:hypothetical protein